MKTTPFYSMRISLMMLVLSLSSLFAFAQKNLRNTDRSDFTGITLPSPGIQDGRALSISSARMILEMAADSFKIPVTGVEVLALPNASGFRNPGFVLDSLVSSLEKSGWQITRSQNPDYFWMNKGSQNLLMYIKEGKKQTELYFGQVDKLPDNQVNKPKASEPSLPKTKPPRNFEAPQPAMAYNPREAKDKIIGSWGNINNSKVHYFSDDTGAWMGSGLSSGYGLELKEGIVLDRKVIDRIEAFKIGSLSFGYSVPIPGFWSFDRLVKPEQLI